MTNEIIFDDKLKEECGVFGVYKTASSTADYVYYGLHALQHRGQESAGIAANDNGVITQIKGMGLVGDVFKPVSYTHLVSALSYRPMRFKSLAASSLACCFVLSFRFTGASMRFSIIER